MPRPRRHRHRLAHSASRAAQRLHPEEDEVRRPGELHDAERHGGCREDRGDAEGGRGDLDPTLKPESLFYLDPNAPTPHTYAEILRVWNFLMMDIDVAGDLRLRVIDATGAERYRLDLAARSH